MGVPDLAVIIPYCGEYPHLHYTLQSLQTELDGFIDYEVLIVDNTDAMDAASYGVRPQRMDNERSLDLMTGGGTATPWLRRIRYGVKTSHWGAKNKAVGMTDAAFLFFIDAHCLIGPGTLRAMFREYSRGEYDGSLHLPIADFFTRGRSKVYRLLYDPDIGLLHYENEDRKPAAIERVPVQSTCGMLCRREHIVDDIGYWPEELGPYGGGENYYLFTMARLGRGIHLFPAEPIRHWHLTRGRWSRDYMPTWRDWARNIMIATYLVAGEEWLGRLVEHWRALPSRHPVRRCGEYFSEDLLPALQARIPASGGLRDRRNRIEERAVASIEDWAREWAGRVSRAV